MLVCFGMRGNCVVGAGRAKRAAMGAPCDVAPALDGDADSAAVARAVTLSYSTAVPIASSPAAVRYVHLDSKANAR